MHVAYSLQYTVSYTFDAFYVKSNYIQNCEDMRIMSEQQNAYTQTHAHGYRYVSFWALERVW